MRDVQNRTVELQDPDRRPKIAAGPDITHGRNPNRFPGTRAFRPDGDGNITRIRAKIGNRRTCYVFCVRAVKVENLHGIVNVRRFDRRTNYRGL